MIILNQFQPPIRYILNIVNTKIIPNNTIISPLGVLTFKLL